jgi:hypothetical protein
MPERASVSTSDDDTFVFNIRVSSLRCVEKQELVLLVKSRAKTIVTG